MARIYVIEPDATGGIGATGALFLCAALERAGHAVTRVVLSSDEDGRQMALFAGGKENALDWRSLARPDAWFVSCLYVRQWVWLPEMFRRIGLAPLAEDRRDSEPLVVFGGQVMLTPEPVAPFADVMALGDGEATGVEIAGLLDAGASKHQVMRDLDGRAGFYVPAHHSSPVPFSRARDGEIVPCPVFPGHRGTGATIELARGCRSKCLYCPIGWAGGTYREADRGQVAEALRRVRGRSVNLFAPDFSSVSYSEEAEGLMASCGCSPRQRDTTMRAAARSLAKGRPARTYSFGIEGVSERLRRAIGKPLAADFIVDTMARLSRAGARSCKWYLILGLPGENASDMEEFLSLLGRVRAVWPHALDITQTHFQSVPHTPLQWAANHYDDGAAERAAKLHGLLRSWWCAELRWLVSNFKGRETHEHDSMLQRCDRRAARYLLRLGGNRARLADGRWRDDAQAAGLNIDATLRAIEPGALTPWSHVDVGQRPGAAARAWAAYRRRMTLDAAPLALAA